MRLKDRDGYESGSDCETVSECLRNDRVVEVTKIDDGTFFIGECCDGFYHAVLSREQFAAWVDELKAML